jgi:hypothetical protein
MLSCSIRRKCGNEPPNPLPQSRYKHRFQGLHHSFIVHFAWYPSPRRLELDPPGILHLNPVSNRIVKARTRIVGILFAFLLLFAATYYWLSTRLLVLTSNRTAKVEIRGAPVAADVLDGTLTTLVTMQKSNGRHSYLLILEGDTDSTGDTGSVVDCHEWASPRIPLLLMSTNHPAAWQLQKLSLRAGL